MAIVTLRKRSSNTHHRHDQTRRAFNEQTTSRAEVATFAKLITRQAYADACTVQYEKKRNSYLEVNQLLRFLNFFEIIVLICSHYDI